MMKSPLVAAVLAVALTVLAVPNTASASTGYRQLTTAHISAGSRAQVVLSTQRILPEWYQFCYNRRAVGITGGQSFYANAYADPAGVNCKYYVVPWRGGFPHYAYHYYRWADVCGQLGYRAWYWDGRYPWCTR